MAVLDYILLLVAGSADNQFRFRAWADRQQGVALIAQNGGKDVYQLKAPASFVEFVRQAQQVGCTVDLL